MSERRVSGYWVSVLGTLIGMAIVVLLIGLVSGDFGSVLKEPFTWILAAFFLVLAHFEGRRGRPYPLRRARKPTGED